jgi:hypothetical protein
MLEVAAFMQILLTKKERRTYTDIPLADKASPHHQRPS